MTARFYGRKPHTPDDRDIPFGEVQAALSRGITVPATFGHANTYPGQGWMMNGNGPELPGEELPSSWTAAKEGAGDCVYAAWVNEVKEALTDAGGDPAAVLKRVGAAKTAITAYKATGYDPVTGARDEGQEVRTRLQEAQKVGLKLADGTVHKAGPYFLVDHTNLQHWLTAMYVGEAVVLGVKVAEQNEEAFNQAEQTGQFPPVWDWAPNYEVAGLHCIPSVGRPDSTHIAALTWARRIFLTPAYRAAAVEEAWVYISPDRYNAITHETYEGQTAKQVEESLAAVAKREG